MKKVRRSPTSWRSRLLFAGLAIALLPVGGCLGTISGCTAIHWSASSVASTNVQHQYFQAGHFLVGISASVVAGLVTGLILHLCKRKPRAPYGLWLTAVVASAAFSWAFEAGLTVLIASTSGNEMAPLGFPIAFCVGGLLGAVGGIATRLACTIALWLQTRAQPYLPPGSIWLHLAAAILSIGTIYLLLAPQGARFQQYVRERRAVEPIMNPYSDRIIWKWGYIERLNFATDNRTHISETALAGLAHLPHLTTLYLQGTDISDAELEYLQKVPNLDWVNLSNTPVTAHGLRDFKKACPRCFVFNNLPYAKVVPPMCPDKADEKPVPGWAVHWIDTQRKWHYEFFGLEASAKSQAQARQRFLQEQLDNGLNPPEDPERRRTLTSNGDFR